MTWLALCLNGKIGAESLASPSVILFILAKIRNFGITLNLLRSPNFMKEIMRIREHCLLELFARNFIKIKFETEKIPIYHKIPILL